MPQDNFASQPAIEIDGAPLDRTLEPSIEHVVVSNDRLITDMFVITFRDPNHSILEKTRIQMGSQVRISGRPVGVQGASLLMSGEVTGFEGEYGRQGARFVVRGLDRSHRLQRGHKSRTWQNTTDSDIARSIAKDHQIQVGTVDESGTVHQHVYQHNVSDWEFLLVRAGRIGYEVGVFDDQFYFRRPTESASAPAAGDYRSSDRKQLVYGMNLLEFFPRLTSTAMISEVKVRGWDPQNKRAIIGSAAAVASSASVQATPAELADQFGGAMWVTADKPLFSQGEADAAAAAIAEHLASDFAVADGIARGDPQLRAGTAVSVSGVASPFVGRYLLSHTKHVFGEHAYRTEFRMGGPQDHSLLGLAAVGAAHA